MHAPAKPMVFCLFGPTASGKTAITFELIKRFPLRIVSVDSAMIYRGMDIGTAKPTAAELLIAPHALIDVCDPSEHYSVGNFCQDATHEINNILADGALPLLVGGTMMYFHALQQGIAALPTADVTVREQLNLELAKDGLACMHKKLHDIDPVAAAKIHPNDPQRVLRALEVYYQTGKPISELQRQTNQNEGYQFINIGLTVPDRAGLHQQISKRFDHMLAAGFLAEVEQLKARPELNVNLPSMRCVGYRQAWQHLAGDIDYQQMRERAIVATRQLAKRQLTWLRSWPELVEFSAPDQHVIDKIASYIAQCLKEY